MNSWIKYRYFSYKDLRIYFQYRRPKLKESHMHYRIFKHFRLTFPRIKGFGLRLTNSIKSNERIAKYRFSFQFWQNFLRNIHYSHSSIIPVYLHWAASIHKCKDSYLLALGKLYTFVMTIKHNLKLYSGYALPSHVYKFTLSTQYNVPDKETSKKILATAKWLAVRSFQHCKIYYSNWKTSVSLKT